MGLVAGCAGDETDFIDLQATGCSLFGQRKKKLRPQQNQLGRHGMGMEFSQETNPKDLRSRHGTETAAAVRAASSIRRSPPKLCLKFT